MRLNDLMACRIVTLCGICLVAFAAIAAGQGFRPSTTTIVGATSTTLQLQQLYKSSQKWKIDYRLQPRAACSSRSRNNLCAAAATDSADAYYELVMATSPRVYSSTNSSQAGAANLVAPPGDQQACQACSAFAVGAAAETAMASALRVNAQDCSISVQSLYFCPSYMPAPSCNAGWDLPSVLAQLVFFSQQIPTAACLPYKPDFKGELSKSAICNGICKDPNRYATQGQFSPISITTIWEAQRHIRHYGSVVTRFDVFSDFRSFFADKRNAKKVYSPSATATYQYGHAVVLVGYDNEKQFWLAKNSWGLQWGDGGFFRVAYGACSVLTLDTGEAYGVIWTPTVKPSSVKLPVIPVGNSTTCYEYKARPGDYLSKIAWLTGIPLDQFMLGNVGNVKDVDVLIPGTKLLLCNPQRDSILPPAGPARPDPQLEALLRIKAAIDTDNVLQGWVKEAGVDGGYCAWRGVVCRGNELVVESIILTVGRGIQGLKGKLPSASTFVGLKSLVEIDVAHQPGITGTIPDWSSLKQLRRVALANNSLGGSVPASFGALPQLKLLYLWQNKLVGSLPESLQRLSVIEGISVGYNELSGTLPMWLRKLPKLRFLDLQQNKFRGTVPASLAECTSLQQIYLSGNKELGGCLPLSLKKQLKLSPQDFYSAILSNTRIDGYCVYANERAKGTSQNTMLVGGSIAPVGSDPQLESLLQVKAALDNDNTVLPGWNRPAGIDGGYCDWIGVECLPGTKKVWKINMWSGINIQGLKGTLPGFKALAGLINLTDLGISDQPLATGRIPEDWAKLKQLEAIRLANNSLSGTIPSSWKGLTKLKLLQLRDNKLVGSIPAWFGDLPSIDTLLVQGNNFGGQLPPNFSKLKFLKELYVSSNKLTGTLPAYLGNFTSLVVLHLHRNNFTGSIPASFSQLRNLQELALASNQLSGTIPESMANLKVLEKLYLWGNPQLKGCMPISWRGQLTTDVKFDLLDKTQLKGFC